MKSSRLPRQKFTKLEDNIIRAKWQEQGPSCLQELTLILGRKRKQIRDRYYFYLAPNVDNGPFTDEDDLILARLVLRYGFKWTLFTKYLKGKGANDVKNRWRLVTSKIKDNDTQKIRKLIANGSMSPLTIEHIQGLDWDSSYPQYLSKELNMEKEQLSTKQEQKIRDAFLFEESFGAIKDSHVGNDMGRTFADAFKESMEIARCREEILQSTVIGEQK